VLDEVRKQKDDEKLRVWCRDELTISLSIIMEASKVLSKALLLG